MIGSTNGARMPGTTLLTIGRLLFNEHVLFTIVQPTIADLQREVADAGPSCINRLRARWRGCRAFWTLTLVAPFAGWASEPGDAGAARFPDAVARLAVGSIVVMLLAVAGPVVGAWVAAVTVAAALVAVVIHRWYERHPSDIPTPPEPQKGTPQINFSSTEVAGNIGGLIFAIGSVIIVAIGLPSVIWFLLVGIVAGCLLAWVLAAWHTSHPNSGAPDPAFRELMRPKG